MSRKRLIPDGPSATTPLQVQAPPLWRPGTAPPIYRPGQSVSQLKPQRDKQGRAAPPVYRPMVLPLGAPPVFRPNMKSLAQSKAGPALTAPPVYRPKPPELSSSLPPARAAVAQLVMQRSTYARLASPPRAVLPGLGAIQRAQQVKGIPGFLEGQLSPSQRKGNRNDVFAQPSQEAGSGYIAHASAKLTQQAKGNVAEYTHIDHLQDDDNTHAEDKLPFHIYQCLVLQYGAGPYPDVINFNLPTYFDSASPCTSEGGTSNKSVGCTENLIAWHKDGIKFGTDLNTPTEKYITVKLTIGRMTVDHLYKNTSKANATASFEALKRLRSEGAIGSFHIQNGRYEWQYPGYDSASK